MVDASARVRVEMVGIEDVAVDALEFGDLRGRGRTDACAHQGFAHRSDGVDDDFLDAAEAVVVEAFDAALAFGGGDLGVGALGADEAAQAVVVERTDNTSYDWSI